MSICAVIVTFNRLDLVKRTIECLKNQTQHINSIIVVDNGCTDGTSEWLDSQVDLDVVHQSNVGGSGGFATGIQRAYDLKYDWIWCMDDDVFPTPDCLEKLLKSSNDQKIGIRCPKRLQNGTPFYSEYKKLNLSNPFKPMHIDLLNDENTKENCFIEAMVFEGPLISRNVVEKIGLPNKDFFILYDDTEYGYRAILAGYKILYVHDAILDKFLFTSNMSSVELRKKNRWKKWYDTRNKVYVNHKYGKNFFIRYIRSIFPILWDEVVIAKNCFISKRIFEKSDMIKHFRSYYRGLKEDLTKLNY